MSVEELIDLILYGDVHEAPYSLLGDNYDPENCIDFDDEQDTRLAIAATIKQLSNQGKLNF